MILTRESLKPVHRARIIEVVRSRLLPLAALGLALVLVVPAAATTIVPAADPGELALDSEAVFLARAGASRVVSRPSFLATETELVVLSVFSGPLAAGGHIRVEAPGGERDGVGWAVAGSPRFVDGEVYLLFADRGADGSWRPRLLADSVLLQQQTEDGVKLLAPLPEASQINRISGFSTDAALVPGPVDEKRFIAALERRLGGKPGWDWAPLVRSGGADDGEKSAPAGCVFMTYDSGDGNPIRWQLFDTGGTQPMAADSNGDPSLPGGGFAEIQNALGRWNGVSSTSLSVSYAGASASPPSSCTVDTDFTTNAVIFDDPCDEIPDLSGCSGTLAFGGPSFFTSTYTWDDQQWHRAVSWFVVVNNGTGACMSSVEYELMLTHEMGHGLGFGHVADPNALMYSFCCNPHNSLDISCTQYLYPVAAPTPSPTATPPPTATPGGPTPTPTPPPIATPTRAHTPQPTPTPTPMPNGSGPSQVTVPVVIHGEGVGGARWRSDVVLTNPNASSQRLRLTYVTSEKRAFSVIRNLAGRAALLLEDVVADLFGAGDGRGPLYIEVQTADSVAPVVVSRTFAENPFGNLGSGLPADVQPSRDVVSMPGLFHDQAFRSNIAVTADDGHDVLATFELFRGNDDLVAGGVRRLIGAGQQDQWSIQQLFQDKAREGVPMTVRVSLSHPGIVNASIVDNASTDSAVFLGKTPATDWIVPVVARIPGANATFWSSSVSLWNGSPWTSRFDLEYLPEKTDNSSGGIDAASIWLEGYETRTIEDVLLDLFNIDDGKGVLVVKSARSAAVTSRVSTDGPLGGTSGNGVRTVRASDFSNRGKVLPGVQMLEGFRTNVGFLTGDRAVNFQFDLRDAGGTLIATAFRSVEPRSLRQLSVEKLFGTSVAVPNPVGSIVVTGDADFLAYLTVIDGTSQDPVFVMPK